MLCPKISEAKRSTGDAGVTGTLYFTSAILITIYFVCPTTMAGLLDQFLQAGYQCRITVNLFPVLNKFYKFPVAIAARGENLTAAYERRDSSWDRPQRTRPRNFRGLVALLVARSWQRAAGLCGTAHGDIARQPFAHLTDADNTEPAGLIRWQPLYHHALA